VIAGFKEHLMTLCKHSTRQTVIGYWCFLTRIGDALLKRLVGYVDLGVPLRTLAFSKKNKVKHPPNGCL
jgi:hypothetical protein